MPVRERHPGTLIIDELPICRHAARADLAVINGHFSGYEIKSDRDTLKRLGSQVDAYCRVFDYVAVVTAQTIRTGFSSCCRPGGG